MAAAADTLALDAPAKINLFLRVTGRRPDGYHLLATLMQKISLCDRVELRRLAENVIRLRCPDSNLPEDEGNLVYRAARLFFEETAFQRQGGGVEITLRKNIPLAAGLGGGSSDAATVLRGLNRIFAAGCTEGELLGLGARLGADVPLFIVDWPVAWATGIGDRLQPAVPLAGYLILLVNPGFSVGTAWVYQRFALTEQAKKINLTRLSDQEGVGVESPFRHRSIRPAELLNDLEAVTAAEHPEIILLKERLLRAGAEAALMTGSGPTVFGLFRKEKEGRAAACVKEMAREYPRTFLVRPLPAC